MLRRWRLWSSEVEEGELPPSIYAKMAEGREEGRDAEDCGGGGCRGWGNAIAVLLVFLEVQCCP